MRDAMASARSDLLEAVLAPRCVPGAQAIELHGVALQHAA